MARTDSTKPNTSDRSPQEPRIRAAGLRCVAVTTPFTREKIHEQELLEDRWIVDDPPVLPDKVHGMIEGHGAPGEGARAPEPTPSPG